MVLQRDEGEAANPRKRMSVATQPSKIRVGLDQVGDEELENGLRAVRFLFATAMAPLRTFWPLWSRKIRDS